MNRRIPFLPLCAAAAGLIGMTWLFAQGPPTADSLNEGTRLEYDATNEIWRFQWWGRAGRTYFIQHSEDLVLWNWVPVIESGDDSVKEWGFTSNADRFFMRLRYTDIPTTDPENDDFDGDGVSNLAEIMQGTNPFAWQDTDDDGLPDDWELYHFGHLNYGASDDPDNDGLTNIEEFQLGTNPGNPDSDGDGITDGGEVDQGTNPNDPNDTPDAEWFHLTGDQEQDVEKSRSRTITIPAGESRVIVILVESAEYPTYTGDGSEFNDTLSWSVRPQGLTPINGSLNVNSRHSQWEQAKADELEAQGFSPVHIENGMTVNAPAEAALSVEIDLTATNIGDGALPSTVLVGLLPLEPVELHPQLIGNDGNAVEGSQNPRTGPGLTNGMIEDNPVANRIAHREIKMRIVNGAFLKGKKLTWSMDPLFVPPAGGNPVFRGDWANSTTSPNRYQTAVHFGANGFEAVNQETARSEIDASGESAIRANLAPVGFNKGRLRVMVEGLQGDPAKVVDMEVPPVIVIDPGHGGTTNLAGSSANNATSPTGILEKNMALAYALELRTALNTWATNNNSQARILLTRDGDFNVSGADRAAVARDNGADVIYIIHFNAFNGTARGTLEVRRVQGNVNAQEDIDFIDRVLNGIVPALQVFDPGANRRAFVEVNTSVASDANLGNQANYHPVRAGYAEVEFIDNPQVDQLLNHGPNAAAIKSAISQATADAIIEDIRTQPSP